MERSYIHKAQTGSTNDDLRELLMNSSTPCFAVISADSQSGGRGRLGRSFFSPPGGLYFSAAYPLDGDETEISFLTLAAGLCAAEAVESLCGAKALIKWPNDLYINEKKLCGILTQSFTKDGKITAAVGIGMNLLTTEEDIPAELKGRMTSLSAEGFTVPEKNALMKAVINRLDGLVYGEGILRGKTAAAAKAINRRSFLKGRRCVYSINGAETHITAGDIQPDGRLEITYPDKSREYIFSGELIIR